MGKVIAFKRNVSRNEVTESVSELLERANQGDLDGFMHFTSTADGRVRINVSGTFADRLQFAAITLVKGLSEIADQIAANSESAGFTSVPAMDEQIYQQPTTLPRLLRSRE